MALRISTGPVAVRRPVGRLETGSDAPSAPRHPRVLVVVAEAEQRQTLTALLGQEEGYELLTLSDADEVMRVAAEFEPDLVLLALDLPGTNGLELCGELKASDTQRLFPVLVVAFESCDESAVTAGLLAGADDFVQTNRPRELKARVRVQLRNKRHLDALTRLRSERDMLRRDAELDPLTGLLNRRALVRAVSRQCDSSRRFGALFIDVDHFKSINDERGHEAGDRVLLALAALLKDCLRPGDVVGRYGGEEFVALIDGAGPESLRLVAERLRHSVEATPLGSTGANPVTVSIGAAVFDPRRGEAPDELLRRADLALYRAKAGGRNCVVLDNDGKSSPEAPAARVAGVSE